MFRWRAPLLTKPDRFLLAVKSTLISYCWYRMKTVSGMPCWRSSRRGPSPGWDLAAASSTDSRRASYASQHPQAIDRRARPAGQSWLATRETSVGVHRRTGFRGTALVCRVVRPPLPSCRRRHRTPVLYSRNESRTNKVLLKREGRGQENGSACRVAQCGSGTTGWGRRLDRWPYRLLFGRD